MPDPDPLRLALALADAPGAVLTWDERARVGFDRWAGVDAAGLLAETAPADAVACDSCGRDHVGRVVWADAPGRPRRAYLPCPADGRVPVAPDRLRQWRADPAALARLMADQLGAAGGVVERAAGRVWRVGAVRLADRVWAVYLAVGLGRPDGTAVIAAVPELAAANGIALVPAAVPPPAVWGPTRPAAVLSLADLLTVAHTGPALDRLAVASAVARPGEPVAIIPPVPLPPATNWADVTLVVEDRHLVVRAGDVNQRVGYAEAGFADQRRAGGGKPNRSWTLLAVLARSGGRLATPDGITTKSDTLKQGVRQLRDRLQALTGLAGDPFLPVGRGGEYRVRFRLQAVGGPVLAVPAGATWDDVTITEVADGLIEFAVDAPGRDVIAGEAATVDAVRTARHPTDALGLTAPAREALLAVLRAGGPVRRPATDRGFLALAAALPTLVPADGPPFDHHRGQWRPRFEPLSVVPPDR